jgi:hypothetical protein
MLDISVVNKVGIGVVAAVTAVLLTIASAQSGNCANSG